MYKRQLLQALPRNMAYGLQALIDQKVAGGEAPPPAATDDAAEAPAATEVTDAAEAPAAADDTPEETAEAPAAADDTPEETAEEAN